MMLFPAAVFDLFSIIPFIGDIFIFFAKLGFWLAGYRSRKGLLLTGGLALAEDIPGLSAILPGCILFVIGSYLLSKESGTVQKVIQEKKKKKVQRNQEIANINESMRWENMRNARQQEAVNDEVYASSKEHRSTGFAKSPMSSSVSSLKTVGSGHVDGISARAGRGSGGGVAGTVGAVAALKESAKVAYKTEKLASRAETMGEEALLAVSGAVNEAATLSVMRKSFVSKSDEKQKVA